MLNSTILEYLHFCWYHPFHESFRSQLVELSNSDPDYYKLKHYSGFSARHGNFEDIELQQIFIEILCTIANLCDIKESNGLSVVKSVYYRLEPLEGENEIDHSENLNFIPIGLPNNEILELCDKIESSFNQDYEIRDISTLRSFGMKRIN